MSIAIHRNDHSYRWDMSIGRGRLSFRETDNGTSFKSKEVRSSGNMQPIISAILDRTRGSESALETVASLYAPAKVQAASSGNSPVKQAEIIYEDWQTDLTERQNGYYDLFQKGLDSYDEAMSEEALAASLWLVDGFSFLQRLDLEQRLDNTPNGVAKQIMKAADELLLSTVSTMKASIISRVDIHNDHIHKANEWYGQWIDRLETSSSDLLDDINNGIVGDSDTITTEELLQIQARLQTWKSNLSSELQNGMSGFPQGIAETLTQIGTSNLELAAETMARFVEDTLRFRSIGEEKAAAYDLQRSKDLQDDSVDRLSDWLKAISEETDLITSEEAHRYMGQLDEWIRIQKESYGEGLAEVLDHSLNGLQTKYEEIAKSRLDALQESLWSTIHEAIDRFNENHKPSDPGNGNDNGNGNGIGNGVPHKPEAVFSSGNIRPAYEFGTGSSKVTLKFVNDNGRKDDTLFYVIDATGVKKAVKVNFASDLLKSEFMSRFKKEKVYGSTISLEKLDGVMDKVKEQLSELAERDLERLRSRLYSQQEGDYLDQWTKKFSSFLEKAKLF